MITCFDHKRYPLKSCYFVSICRFDAIFKVKLPIGLHEEIKAFAQAQVLPVSHLYDKIISDFIEKHWFIGKSADYLFHKVFVEKVAMLLKKNVVYGVKSLVCSDSVSENGIMFTENVRFSLNNSLLVD